MSSGGQSHLRTPASYPPLSPIAPAYHPPRKSPPAASPVRACRLQQDVLSKATTPRKTPPSPLSKAYDEGQSLSPNQTNSPEAAGEKADHRRPTSARSSRRTTPDPEKASQRRHSSHSSPSSNVQSLHSTVIYEEDEDEGVNDNPNDHAVWILIYLSILSPLLTTAVTVYTLLLTFLALLSLPACFGGWRPRLRALFTRLLLPPLHFQLGLIFSADGTAADDCQAGSVAILILVNLLAPIAAICVAVATWVAGAFWLFAKILGNPASSNSGSSSGGLYQPNERNEGNDGRAAVIAVRDCWERYLALGLS